MSKRTLLGLALALTLASLPPSAFPQAAAEYSTTTGSAATSATKAGSAINQGTNALAGRLQKSMEKTLDSPSVGTPRRVNTMEENRKKLELKSQAGGGLIHIDSVPAKATVLIDGSSVAYTSADLKIPNGKHTIEVADPTHLPWRKEVTLNHGENLSFKPQLEEKYKSEIVLSFQQ